MEKTDRYERAKTILSKSKRAAGGKVSSPPPPPPSTDGEPDMDPAGGKKRGGKVASGKKPKHRADKKRRE